MTCLHRKTLGVRIIVAPTVWCFYGMRYYPLEPIRALVNKWRSNQMASKSSIIKLQVRYCSKVLVLVVIKHMFSKKFFSRAQDHCSDINAVSTQTNCVSWWIIHVYGTVSTDRKSIITIRGIISVWHQGESRTVLTTNWGKMSLQGSRGQNGPIGLTHGAIGPHWTPLGNILLEIMTVRHILE